MNTDELIVEARAKIIWGDEPASVRAFLTINGMSATDADATLKGLVHERNAEIRKIGIRDVVIGGALLIVSGISLYSIFESSQMPDVTVSGGKSFGVLILTTFFGLWKLITGIIRLSRPQSEHESIPDITD